MRIKTIVFYIIISIFSFSTTVLAGSAKEPEVYAEGAAVVEYETGRLIWGKNEHMPLAMASTTKIMTAVIALEEGNLSDVATISGLAANAPKVRMGLSKGERITVEALLHALMLESSNDAAVAIAEQIHGSVERFCEAMTMKAKEIGALNTSFETPNGLDAEGHFSTAYDLALITRYALRNDFFVRLINTRHITVKSDKKAYDLRNRNRFLSEYDGAFGVKTGFTNLAGNCFVGAAEQNGMKLVSVVLASGWGQTGKERKWTDTRKVMDYAFDSFSFRKLISEGEPAGESALARAREAFVPLRHKRDVVLPVSDEEFGNMTVTVKALPVMPAPVKKGEYAGTVKIYSGVELLYEGEVVAGEDIDRHDLKTSAEKVLNGFLQLGTNGGVWVALPDFSPPWEDK